MPSEQPTKDQSDTPRTNAADSAWEVHGKQWVTAEFARQLERELIEATKDAERYRWLRGQRRWYAAFPPVPGIAFKFENFIADNGETLDAAIDAAMVKS